MYLFLGEVLFYRCAFSFQTKITNILMIILHIFKPIWVKNLNTNRQTKFYISKTLMLVIIY